MWQTLQIATRMLIETIADDKLSADVSDNWRY